MFKHTEISIDCIFKQTKKQQIANEYEKKNDFNLLITI